jgi:hypothetical protein
MMACLLISFTGCSDFDLFNQPSLLYARRDRPGLPRYLDKHESSVVINGTASNLSYACRDALLMLGCSKIVENKNALRGDRAFILGFDCGVGGETLYVTSDQLKEDRYLVQVVSYKRVPYPAATRFLDADFCDLLVQILYDDNIANTP